jgi:hypothetical protein
LNPFAGASRAIVRARIHRFSKKAFTSSPISRNLFTQSVLGVKSFVFFLHRFVHLCVLHRFVQYLLS